MVGFRIGTVADSCSKRGKIGLDDLSSTKECHKALGSYLTRPVAKDGSTGIILPSLSLARDISKQAKIEDTKTKREPSANARPGHTLIILVWERKTNKQRRYVLAHRRPKPKM
jgi:hypothetical protein